MMIFPKKLQQDTPPQAEAPGQPPPPEQEGEPQLPNAWRVVLEDGTTSDDSSTPQAAGAGGKLLAEMTEALEGRAARKSHRSRPRNVAMPSSPPQPLHALDDSLQPETTARCVPKTRPASVAPTVEHGRTGLRGPGGTGPVGRSSGNAAADPPADILAGHTAPTRPREIDARLARVIDLWPRLPRGIQVAILAMIEVEATDSR